MKRQISSAIIAMAITWVPAMALAVNCCAVNGGSCNLIPPLTHGQSGWMGSVCGTTLSGTNCVALLDANVSSSAGSDCVTLGSGVTFDMAGFTMDCTASSPSTCGAAVKNTNSGGTSSAVVITNGTITGRWSTGISVTGGTNSSVTEVNVSGAGTGISGVRGPIDFVMVTNSSGNGIVLTAGEDLKKSVLANNGNGGSTGAGLSLPSGSYSNTDMDDVIFYDNYWSINDQGTGSASIQRSALTDATNCHCYANVSGSSACRTIDQCVTITNGAVPTFVDDTLHP